MATPFRTWLYRSRGWAVICLVIVAAVPFTLAQFARKSTQSKGPRALGLLELLPSGKARLRPICIMINGKFYDAGVYKADPVPMALDSGVVYEAQRTGEPDGLFTIKNVLQNNATRAFVAEGSWVPAGAEPAKSASMKAETKPKAEDDDKPPVLRRPGSEPSPADTKTAPNPPAESKPPEEEDSDRPILRKPAGENPTAPAKAPDNQSPGASTAASEPAPASSAPAERSEENDPNRPQLRRGPPSPVKATTQAPEKAPAPPAHAKSKAASAPPPTGSQPQVLPAISDADGPEPRPYTYDMTPKEEEGFRTKVLAIASKDLVKQARELEPELVAGAEAPRTARAGRQAARPAVLQPVWDDVQLRVFDVATSNEPILVLSAKGHLPQRARTSAKVTPGSAVTEFYVTEVAHSDLYGELRSLFSAVTDDDTLDVTPKYQLIDVVDADGDGRGELLFRQTSDQGNSFVVYRVGADRLWALYEGTPAGQ